MQGAAGNVIVLQPTKSAMTFCDIDPGRWIDVPASIFMSSFCDGLWLTQEPPCRFSNNLLSINLMSLQCLYGFCNLSSCELKGKGQLPILASHDHGDGFFYCSSGPFRDSLVTGLFLHVRCIPHSTTKFAMIILSNCVQGVNKR